MKAVSYLVLIEEASVVGTLLKGTINKVEKLLFLPLNLDTKLKVETEDLPIVQMIKQIQNEKAFYFSYDIDLTKNIQRTVSEI